MSSKADKRLYRKLQKQNKIKNDNFSKQPVLQSSTDNDDYLIFSLKNLVNGYDLKSEKCTDYIRSQLLLKLQTTCCHTWNMLFTKDKQSGGLEILDKSIFKIPMPACVTEDINHLYVLRFNSQKSRLIGYRSDNIFHIIFVDIDLSTYNH